MVCPNAQKSTDVRRTEVIARLIDALVYLCENRIFNQRERRKFVTQLRRLQREQARNRGLGPLDQRPAMAA
jgi:hypothetical protein